MDRCWQNKPGYLVDGRAAVSFLEWWLVIGLLSFVVLFRILMKLKQLPYYSPLGSKFRSPDEYWLPFHMGVPDSAGFPLNVDHEVTE